MMSESKHNSARSSGNRRTGAQSKTSGKRSTKTDNQKKADIEARIRKRVALEEKAFRLVEMLLDNPISEQKLLEAGQHIDQNHYSDVVEERSITSCCGYPLCQNSLTQVPKQKYHISMRSNKVYDITERKKFCSNQCYKASQYFEKQISTTPVWLRENEAPINFDLLGIDSNCGSQGELVILSPGQVIKEELSVIEAIDSRRSAVRTSRSSQAGKLRTATSHSHNVGTQPQGNVFGMACEGHAIGNRRSQTAQRDLHAPDQETEKCEEVQVAGPELLPSDTNQAGIIASSFLDDLAKTMADVCIHQSLTEESPSDREQDAAEHAGKLNDREQDAARHAGELDDSLIGHVDLWGEGSRAASRLSETEGSRVASRLSEVEAGPQSVVDRDHTPRTDGLVSELHINIPLDINDSPRKAHPGTQSAGPPGPDIAEACEVPANNPAEDSLRIPLRASGERSDSSSSSEDDQSSDVQSDSDSIDVSDIDSFLVTPHSSTDDYDNDSGRQNTSHERLEQDGHDVKNITQKVTMDLPEASDTDIIQIEGSWNTLEVSSTSKELSSKEEEKHKSCDPSPKQEGRETVQAAIRVTQGKKITTSEIIRQYQDSQAAPSVASPSGRNYSSRLIEARVFQRKEELKEIPFSEIGPQGLHTKTKAVEVITNKGKMLMELLDKRETLLENLDKNQQKSAKKSPNIDEIPNDSCDNSLDDQRLDPGSHNLTERSSPESETVLINSTARNKHHSDGNPQSRSHDKEATDHVIDSESPPKSSYDLNKTDHVTEDGLRNKPSVVPETEYFSPKISSSTFMKNIRRAEDQKTRISHLESSSSVSVSSTDNKSVKPKKKKKLKPLDLMKQTLLDWKTPETVRFLTRGSDMTQPSDFEQRYAELGRKVDRFGDLIDSADMDESEYKPSGKLPSMQELEQNKDFDVKVAEFYGNQNPSGNSGPVTKPKITAAGRGKKSKGVIANDMPTDKEIVLPMVDSYAQRSYRRKIVLDRLSRVFPELLGPLRISIAEVTSDLKELIKTFNLTSTNIVLKPAEWTLIAYFLLKLLSGRCDSLQVALSGGLATHYFRTMLLSLSITETDVKQLIDNMQS